MRTFRDELILFFTLNPDEELTSPDLCDKFGKTRGQMYDALNAATRDGIVQRKRVGQPYLYSIGPWLKERLATLTPRNPT